MLTSTRPVPENFNPAPIRDILARQKRGEEPEFISHDDFPVYADDPLHDSHVLLHNYLLEASRTPGEHSKLKPATLTHGKAILDTPIEQWPVHLRAILRRLLFYWTHCVKPGESFGKLQMWSYNNDGKRDALRPLVMAMLRSDPPITEDDFVELIDARLAGDHSGGDVEEYFTINGIMRIAEKLLERGGLTPTLRGTLSRFRESRKKYIGWGDREEQARVFKLDDLLGEAPAERKDVLEAGEPWAKAALALVKKEPAKWEPLLRHCADSDASKPSGKWLKEAKKKIDAIGGDLFARVAGEWLNLAAQPRTTPLREDQIAMVWRAQFDIYSEKNENVLKGFAWACGGADDPRLSQPLGGLAEWCYKKIPNLGPRSPKVGNACLISLIGLPGQEPRAELSRLKAKVKQPTAKKMIEKAIGASAAAAGMTPDDLEELAVAGYGLTDVGRGEQKIGKYTAETRITGTTKVALTFTDAKGKSRASVPADLKGESTEALKTLQQQVKDLSKMLPALRDRLERLPMNRRELPMESWRQRYLDHPVVGTLARRVIWEFSPEGGKKTLAGIWLDGTLVNADGKSIGKVDEAKTIVRLWQPVGAPADDVLAWRQFLQKHEITQPFKQAHREVYLLTDAERETRTYSNRFAAHILRQHIFAALCTQRGWKYKLMGTWDGGAETIPSLALPKWNLRAEYWLAWGQQREDAPMSQGVVDYISTDQVRFYETDAKEPMKLEKVPPLAFSEVMRDVDLFVGVASIANDPAWRPGGVEGRAAEDHYWQNFSFGELTQPAKTRHEILKHLVPKLKIASQLKLSDRFLIVTGKLRTYKIHLGSGNILMEPNDQYLCIVRDPRDRSNDVFLPFEGDTTLSLILSKAFMLADDEKIEDQSIVRQIKGATSQA